MHRRPQSLRWLIHTLHSCQIYFWRLLWQAIKSMVVISHNAKTSVLLRVNKIRAHSTSKRTFASELSVLIPSLWAQKWFISITTNMTILIRIANNTILISVLLPHLLLKVLFLGQLLLLKIMLLKPLLINYLLSPRVETHTSVLHSTSLRVLLLKLFYGLITVSNL